MTTVSDIWNPAGALQGEAARRAQLDHATSERIKAITVTNSDSPDIAATIATAVASLEKELPTGKDWFAKAQTMRREIEAAKVNSRSEARIKAALLARVNKHIYDGQQTPMTNASFNDHNLGQRAYTKGAAASRASRLDALKIAALIVLHPLRFLRPDQCKADLRKLAPNELVLTFKTADGGLIANRLAVAAKAAIDLESARLETFNVIQVESRLEELKLALPDAEADELQAIQAELATLRAPEAKDIAAIQNRKLKPLRAAFAEAVESLKTETIAALRKVLADAIDCEANFFAQFALPRSATPVSARYEQAIAQVEAIHPGEGALRWWGVKDVAEAELWGEPAPVESPEEKAARAAFVGNLIHGKA